MDIVILEASEEMEAENNLVLKLRKPYTFEGTEYTEIDMSNLENMTGRDMSAVSKYVTKKNKGINPVTVEMSLEYAQAMATRVTKMPIEFFENLPARDCAELKGLVVGFLYGADGEA